MKPENQKPLLGHGGTMGVPKHPKEKRPRKPVGLQIPETKQHEVADLAIAIRTGLQVFVPKSRTDIAVARPNEFEGWTKEDLQTYMHTGKKPGEEEF